MKLGKKTPTGPLIMSSGMRLLKRGMTEFLPLSVVLQKE